MFIGGIIATSYAFDLKAQGAPWTSYLELPLVGTFGVVGLVMLVVYRNWYTTITEDTIHWRTRLLGRTHTLPFEEIVGYKTWDSKVGPTVKVWGRDGQRVGFPLAYFDAKPLMAHLRSRSGIKRN